MGLELDPEVVFVEDLEVVFVVDLEAFVVDSEVDIPHNNFKSDFFAFIFLTVFVIGYVIARIFMCTDRSLKKDRK